MNFLTIRGVRASTPRGYERVMVPKVHRFFQDTNFDPATTHAMCEAYVNACRALPDSGQPEMTREIIAKKIIQAAKDGERDPTKMCERALRASSTAAMSAR